MKSKFFPVLLIGLLLLTLGCNSDDGTNPNNINGTYDGIFTVQYKNGEAHSNPVTVNFASGKFSSSSGPGRFPAGGSGTFTVQKSVVLFSDENFWTAEFDWGLILNGTYDYSIRGDELVLSRDSNDVGLYRYELRRN
ncbi:hypothetical protein WIW50_11970 [Flavobacteriaceae bacterium 3-367]|uniref:hypothetical protein n=1 Tax=Eudoraea algarum TaxID=3417568 RepID=UPI0032841B47